MNRPIDLDTLADPATGAQRYDIGGVQIRDLYELCEALRAAGALDVHTLLQVSRMTVVGGDRETIDGIMKRFSGVSVREPF